VKFQEKGESGKDEVPEKQFVVPETQFLVPRGSDLGRVQ
jgi:hypothetical protein